MVTHARHNGHIRMKKAHLYGSFALISGKVIRIDNSKPGKTKNKQLSKLTLKKTDRAITNGLFRNIGFIIMMYKVMHGLFCIPESSYMVQTSDSRARGANILIQRHTIIAAYKQSFFQHTIQEWNRLPIAVTNATKLEEFKANLLLEMTLQQTA